MADRSPSKVAASTAEGPMAIVAIDQFEPPGVRMVEDALAIEFLSPVTRATVRACRWRPLRGLMRRLTEAVGPGVWNGVLCRKRYIDTGLAEALDAGIASVLVLGAGLDTRACRVVAPTGRAAFEVDLPANVTAKARAIRRALGAVPPELRLVAMDFEADDLAARLAEAGFDFDRPAFVIWEGVTQYLDAEAVRRSLAALAGLAPGSQLVFTYVLADLIAGTAMHGGEKFHRRFVEKMGIWKFGLMPETAAALLGEFGWQIVDDAGSADYAARFGLGASAARDIMAIERIALAEKRG